MAGKYKRSGPDVHAVRKEAETAKNKGTLESPVFLKACELGETEATKRQAMKWNHGMGVAFAHRFEAKRVVG